MTALFILMFTAGIALVLNVIFNKGGSVRRSFAIVGGTMIAAALIFGTFFVFILMPAM